MMHRTMKAWVLIGILAAGFVLPANLFAAASAEKCAKAVQKEPAKFARTLEKAMAKCLRKIGKSVDQGADASQAATVCLAQFYKIGRTDGKSPADKMLTKIEKSCGSGATVDVVQAECEARRAVAAQFPRTLEWLDLMDAELGASGHSAAPVALDALQSANAAIEGSTDDDLVEILCIGSPIEAPTDTPAETPTATATETPTATPSETPHGDPIATSLEFTEQPTDTQAGVEFTLQLAMKDQYGDVVNNFYGLYYLTLNQNQLYQSGAAVTELEVEMIGGVATISNLSVRKADTGYSFTATSGAFTLTSNSFAVTANAVQHVAYLENGVPVTTPITVFLDTVRNLGHNPDRAQEVILSDDYGNRTSSENTLWGYQIVARPEKAPTDKSQPGKLEGFPTNVGAVFTSDSVFGINWLATSTLYFITQKAGDYTVRITSGTATPWDIQITAIVNGVAAGVH